MMCISEHRKLYGSGLVCIPAFVRKCWQVKPGDEVRLSYDMNQVIITRADNPTEALKQAPSLT